MNRVREYIRFAVCFSGLGYIVLWVMTGQESSMALHLSPGLHLAGMMSSACVVIGLLVRLFLRGKCRRGADRAAYTPAAFVRLRLGQRNAPPPQPPRYVPPRSHFGLRRAPH